MINLKKLSEQNETLRLKIEQFKKQSAGHSLRTEIENFLVDSKKNIKEMNDRVESEQGKINSKLHQATKKYESVLKNQLNLLTENKSLSEQREKQQKKINLEAQKLTKEYETKISQYETKVQKNVKRLQELGSKNIISRLIKNQKFKAALKQRGCFVEGLEKQQELQKVAAQVQEKEILIQEAEERSGLLDQELQKMRQLLQTMRQLMENMQKQKQNILKQNTMLKQKLDQSEQLISKLMGSQIPQDDKDQEQQQKTDEQVQ